jgi:hypothetical protein
LPGPAELLFAGSEGYAIDAALLGQELVTYVYGETMRVERFSLSGQPRWQREFGAPGRNSWSGRLAVTPRGELRVWVAPSSGNEGTWDAPTPFELRGLDGSGQPLWSQKNAGCDPQRLWADSRGFTTFVEGMNCGRVMPAPWWGCQRRARRYSACRRRTPG